jgi:hypothetical protein
MGEDKELEGGSYGMYEGIINMKQNGTSLSVFLEAREELGQCTVTNKNYYSFLWSLFCEEILSLWDGYLMSQTTANAILLHASYTKQQSHEQTEDNTSMHSVAAT